MHFWRYRNRLLGTSNHRCRRYTFATKVKVILSFPRLTTKQGSTPICGHDQLLPSLHPFWSKNYETPIQDTVKRWFKRTDGVGWYNDFSLQIYKTTKITILFHPHISAWTTIAVDTSDTVIRGVLEEHINSQWWLLTFFSRQLRHSE